MTSPEIGCGRGIARVMPDWHLQKTRETGARPPWPGHRVAVRRVPFSMIRAIGPWAMTEVDSGEPAFAFWPRFTF
jgi:hypothetical protein